ncbi:CRTAC1 family protein [Pseudomarimonas arenosa]|uniref:CRTAC1 family protein n=1 Tax=Pseudomarimonas arenosa TaxID=2774145 RepID=A0AAW3ZT60_9GAMM|nr:CRTAC1 family protein [Pseudomarimonas arenosa]MBD8528159.1 CRTAC1 family protein [Pseudomarimonas arenosa]
MHSCARTCWLGLSLLLTSCSPSAPPSETVDAGALDQGAPPTVEAGVKFVDEAEASGLRFTHWNGMAGQTYFVEPVGAGAGLADLDGDGDLDVILVQGAALVTETQSEEYSPLFEAPVQPGTRVFRNDLQTHADGERRLAFVDVTDQSGLEALGYGMGVATGDFDNDGRIDFYLANFGDNQLWRNVSSDGKIAFENVTASAGVNEPKWSTSASFVDLNGDGWLDLYVANYVDFTLERHRICRSASGRQDYCGPNSYEGEPDRLFLNRGNGTFQDISVISGIAAEPSSGLGVVSADLDRDGLIDIYVANDLRRNLLWRNLGSVDGVPRFEETALLSGTAVSMEGRAQASMGIVAGDLDADGDDDLFMTHLMGDTNTLYLNDGNGSFRDVSLGSGMAAPSRPFTGFGTVLIDVENNGTLDAVVANGEVRVIEEQALAKDPLPLRQVNQLFINNGSGRFVDQSAQAGIEFDRLEVSRALALGDVDNDGRSDLLLSNNSGPARLLMNRTVTDNQWLGLRVLTAEGRDALGAQVAVEVAEGRWLWRRVATDGSYLAANDPRVLVGLGPDARKVNVRVRMPGAGEQAWEALEAGRYHTLVLP